MNIFESKEANEQRDDLQAFHQTPEGQNSAMAALTITLGEAILTSQILNEGTQLMVVANIASGFLGKRIAQMKQHIAADKCAVHIKYLPEYEKAHAQIKEAFITLAALYQSDKGIASTSFTMEMKPEEKMPEIVAEPALVEFDNLMKIAIAKVKSKKEIADEVSKLVTLLTSYTGALPVMQTIKAELITESKEGKAKVMTSFIKQLAK